MRTVYALAALGRGTFDLTPRREMLSIAELKLRATPQSAADIPRLSAEMACGNEDAFQEFFKLYFDRLLRYLLVITRSEEQAREALQATLVRVARHAKKFESEPAFWSWLTVLARSSAADEGRRSRRYMSFLGRFLEHKQIEGEQEETDLDTRLMELLKINMAALPEDERQLLERKYFDHESVRQIAEQMKLSEKAIESRLGRARRRLEDEIFEQLKHER